MNPHSASFAPNPASTSALTSRSLSDLPPPGLFPNDPSVSVRPPRIPKDAFKRINTKAMRSVQGAVLPKQKDTNKWIQPVKDVGKYIRAHNNTHSEEPRLHYRWWGDEYSDSQITDILIGIVESKATLRIPDLFGILTYEQAQKAHPQRMEEFVVEVAFDPFFDPLTQTARVFGVRSLIASKMTTKRRTHLRNKKKMTSLEQSTVEPQQQTEGNFSGQNTGSQQLAPMYVPDLPAIERSSGEMPSVEGVTPITSRVSHRAAVGRSSNNAAQKAAAYAPKGQHALPPLRPSASGRTGKESVLKDPGNERGSNGPRRAVGIGNHGKNAKRVGPVRVNPLVPASITRHISRKKISEAASRSVKNAPVAGSAQLKVQDSDERQNSAIDEDEHAHFVRKRFGSSSRRRDAIKPMFPESDSEDEEKNENSEYDERDSDNDEAIADRLAELQRQQDELRRMMKRPKKQASGSSKKARK